MKMVGVVMGTHEDTTASVAAKAGDAELLAGARQSPQMLPCGASRLPWKRQNETLGQETSRKEKQ